MAYFLFLLVNLVNAALLLRPGDIIPELETSPGVYEVLIVLCLAVSLPRVLSQLTPGSLHARPISACVVGLMVLVVISAVFNYETWEQWFGPRESPWSPTCVDCAKVLLYYLLLVG
jgi:hypothetical protein